MAETFLGVSMIPMYYKNEVRQIKSEFLCFLRQPSIACLRVWCKLQCNISFSLKVKDLPTVFVTSFCYLDIILSTSIPEPLHNMNSGGV